MNCNSLEALLIEYLDGRLAAANRAAVEEHLGSCAACAGRVEGFRVVSRSLEGWEAPEISPWFQTRLRQRIAQEAERRSWLGSLRLLLRPAYALGIAAILLAGSLVLWNARPASSRLTPAPQPSALEQQRVDEIMPVVDDYEILAHFEILGELKQEKNKL